MKATPRDGRLAEILAKYSDQVGVLTPLQLRIYRARVAGLEPEAIAELVGRSQRKVSIILARVRARLEAAAGDSVTGAGPRA